MLKQLVAMLLSVAVVALIGVAFVGPNFAAAFNGRDVAPRAAPAAPNALSDSAPVPSGAETLTPPATVTPEPEPSAATMVPAVPAAGAAVSLPRSTPSAPRAATSSRATVPLEGARGMTSPSRASREPAAYTSAASGDPVLPAPSVQPAAPSDSATPAEQEPKTSSSSTSGPEEQPDR